MGSAYVLGQYVQYMHFTIEVLVATEKSNVNERRLLRKEEENWISFCYLFI